MRFYVMHDTGGTGKTTVLNRYRKHYGVGLAFDHGSGPLLYDGLACGGRLARQRAVERMRERAEAGRLVIVATNDARLLAALALAGARHTTPEALDAMLDEEVAHAG